MTRSNARKKEEEEKKKRKEKTKISTIKKNPKAQFKSLELNSIQ